MSREVWNALCLDEDRQIGTQYPSVTIGQDVIKVAPVWFLLENDFEIKSGTALSVVVTPTTVAKDSYLYAIEITNTATQAHIVLRNSSGFPAWGGGRGMRGSGKVSSTFTRGGAGCVDPATITVVTGIVDKVSMGAGIEMPTLIVKSADSSLVTMKIGPERILLEADFELREGEQVTAKYAHVTCTDENIALELTNAGCDTLVLWDDIGKPAWN